MRRVVSILVLISLCFLQPVPGAVSEVPLIELVERPYLELLSLSSSVRFASRDFESVRRQLESRQKEERKALGREQDLLKQKIKSARKELAEMNRASSRDTASAEQARNDLHCRILALEDELRQVTTKRDHGLPIAYENRFAKLDLIQQWPSRKQRIDQMVESGAARQRVHGDVEDIGVRIVGEGQEKDVQIGRDAIREMERQRLMPAEIEDSDLRAYLDKLVDRLAAHSDLRVPVKTTVLDSEEINAFALPGGFLFVNMGLLHRADSEAELVGVLSHEIAHVAARHGTRLMKRATITNLLFQAAQVAAVLFTGPIGVGAYYALEYGFYGLGMVLDLALLGVSRDFEIEADQLGVQYAWKAGYDPQGFITFFDKMASEAGYVKATSFFRTHPPFLERIVTTFGEMAYLPAREEFVTDTSLFQEVKKRVQEWDKKRRDTEMNRPSLGGPKCPRVNPVRAQSGSRVRTLTAPPSCTWSPGCTITTSPS